MKNSNILAFFAIASALAFALFYLAISSTEKSETALPQKTVVVVDAGHGGIDGGAFAYGVFEADVNLCISKYLQADLLSLNFDVVMTREDEAGLYGDTSAGFKKRDMLARKEIAESSGGSVFISIHQNASTISDRTGVVIYYSKDSEESFALASAVAENFPSATVKAGDYFVTTKINMPSIIVECGFLTTQSENALLQTESYQREIATNIARGVFQYLIGR